MDIEHCDRLSWFCEGAKAMSKTARGCRLRPCRKPKQRPAILPWPSSLPLNERAIIRPVFLNRQRSRCRLNSGFIPVSASKRANTQRKSSTANTQPFDQRLVTRCVDTGEVVEELATLGHKLEQSTPGM